MRPRDLCAAILALSFAGCGYALVGRASALPDSVKVIAVPSFRNSSPRPGVEQWVSEAVTRELASRGRFSVVPDSAAADAVLEGEVRSYDAFPSAVDPQDGRATEYQIVVVVTARLVSRDGTVLMNVPDFRFQDTYQIVRSSAPSEYSDLENVVVEALSSRFAESLVAALVEGF